MAEDKKSTGISAARAGLGLLTGILVSYICPTALVGKTAIAGRALWSVGYMGLAAIVNKLFDGKEKTTLATSIAEGAAHFGGRTLGDYLRRYAWYYAPRCLY